MNHIASKFLWVGVALISGISHAEDARMAFHLECDQPGESCVSYDLPSGGTVLGELKPRLMLGPAEIEEVILVTGPAEPEQLSFRMKESSAQEFSQLTGGNIGKKLILRVDHTVLMAPTIRAPIQGGRVSLTLGRDGPSAYFDRLPWLKEIGESEKTASSKEQVPTLLYLGLAALAFVVFFWKRLKRGSTTVTHSQD